MGQKKFKGRRKKEYGVGEKLRKQGWTKSAGDSNKKWHNRWPELQEDSKGMKATTDTKTGGGQSR